MLLNKQLPRVLPENVACGQSIGLSVGGPVLDQGLQSGKTRGNLLLYLLTRIFFQRLKKIFSSINFYECFYNFFY